LEKWQKQASAAREEARTAVPAVAKAIMEARFIAFAYDILHRIVNRDLWRNVNHMQSVDTVALVVCWELVGRWFKNTGCFYAGCTRTRYVRRFTMAILFRNSAHIVALGGTCTGSR
jgi:hypothetical protein